MKLILHFMLVLLAAQSKSETVENEDVQVKWTNSAGSSSNQDTHPLLPEKVVFTLTIGKETVELNLIKKKNDDFEEVPVILGNNENVKAWHHSTDEEFSVYSDNSKDASFTVVVKAENGVPMKEYHGSFVHNGIKYTLTPANLHEETHVPTDIIHTFSLDGTQYDVYEDKEQRTGKGEVHIEDVIKPDLNDKAKSPEKTEATDYEVPMAIANGNPEKESNLAGSVTKRERSPRRKRSSKNLIVDLAVIVDNSMYMRWLKMNGNDKDKNIRQIRYFLAYVLNGVNNVYTSMTSYRLTFKVVEIFMAQTSLQSQYLEDSKAKPFADKRKINFTASLEGFTQWVNESTLREGEVLSTTKFLKPHDIAIAFTDYNNEPVEGLAYLGTVCGNVSQGLVHAVDQYSTISTTAHEIGHVLGSAHDGKGNKCNPNDQFLMTDLYSGDKIENRGKMSSCSSDQIKTKIEELIRKGQNCMDPSKKRQRERFDLDKLRTTYPGVHFGPDMQCQLKFGDGYKFCSRGNDTGLNMCSKMSCLNTQDMSCYNNKEFAVAIDGTTCGKGKWCVKGECLPGAPVKPEDKDKKDTCYFGDKSDKFSIDEKTMQCEDLLKKPKLCKTAAGWCCETCEKLKHELSDTCDDEGQFNYGGKTITCEHILNNPWSCYDLDQYCCKACTDLKNEKKSSDANCAYGNRNMRIQTDRGIVGCEFVRERTDLCDLNDYKVGCCESCDEVKKAQKTPPISTEVTQSTCVDEKGRFDHAGKRINCKHLLSNASLCYEFDKRCCKTCADIKKKKALPYDNCAYGDRYSVIIVMFGKKYGCESVLSKPTGCSPVDIERCCETCGKAKKNGLTQTTTKKIEGTTLDSCVDTNNVRGKIIDCKSLLQTPGKCYSLKQYCCKTCSDIKRRKVAQLGPKCPYGDIWGMKVTIQNIKYECSAASWKDGICSNSFNKQSCCESCSGVNLGQRPIVPEIK